MFHGDLCGPSHVLCVLLWRGGGLAALGREGLWGCGAVGAGECGGVVGGVGRCGALGGVGFVGGVRMEGVGSTCDPRGLEV